ncbi:MAG: hypothetical protein A2015_09730 [Spirochaetes bacterium GWF1_31_7]|nr:MAG: hypothetical protein A2Y30_04445 [Spirochaetes bacterium GWE1_32_154]OHD47566.1 MAG: hypothetical protein A2015_09730 [Spirochaetes bacterium GWF1_31_7]OHD52055.1 MAG: hypothetical protein A2Y29_17490 [Spirochaetes bacterium GWE2_31_10]OHD73820.1 MAG: hypothetical protein A2355_02790 [Spirochaetes bacterium RIFOXYB1_FULL_32_8]HBD93476.1 hypothetical protein [Spirochaetia bacterium]
MSIYVCKVCGHIEFEAAPENCPVCFAPKDKFDNNNTVFTDAMEKSKEGAVKHIPVVQVVQECGLVPEKPCTDILVRIGETLHPMEDKHFIQFIDCYVDHKYVSRIMLTPMVNPSVVFHLKETGSKVQIVEMCNLHGHWMKEEKL